MAYGYLAHHGIKGQKWGIRRFQNEDGTLTAEGQRHYGIYEKYKKSSNKFDSMASQLNKNRKLLKDKSFMDEYKKTGDEFEGYFKNKETRKSIKIGKKIEKSLNKIKGQSINKSNKELGNKVTKYVLSGLGSVAVAAAIGGTAVAITKKKAEGPTMSELNEIIKKSLKD